MKKNNKRFEDYLITPMTWMYFIGITIFLLLPFVFLIFPEYFNQLGPKNSELPKNLLDLISYLNNYFSQTINFIFYLAVASVFLIFKWMFFFGLNNLRKSFNETIIKLQNYKRNSGTDPDVCNELSDFFKDNKFLGHSWNEFSECIVEEKNKEGNVTCRNTVESDDFFNSEDSLNGSHIWFLNLNFGFFESVPNILTSLGILGTFIGILMGLPDDFNDPDMINMFISGIKTSFGTSVMGLSLGILFSLFERAKFDRITNRIHQISELLDKIFKRKTQQEYLFEIQGKTDEMVGQIKTAITDMTKKVGKSVVEALDGGGIKTAELEEMTRRNIKTRSDNLKENFDLMKEADEEYQKKAKELLKGFKNVGLGLTNANSAINNFSEKMDNSSDHFTDATQTWNQVTENSKEVFKEQKESSDIILTSIEKSSDVIQGLGNLSEGMKDHFTALSQDLKGSLELITEKLTEYSEKTNSGLTKNLETYDEHLGNGVRKLGQSVDGLSEFQTDLQDDLDSIKKTFDKLNILTERFNNLPKIQPEESQEESEEETNKEKSGL